MQARGRQERAKEEHYWAEGTKSHAGRLQDDAENHRLAELLQQPLTLAGLGLQTAIVARVRGQGRLLVSAPAICMLTLLVPRFPGVKLFWFCHAAEAGTHGDWSVLLSAEHVFAGMAKPLSREN